MELKFLWKLAHQLDEDTFMEVYSLLDNAIEVCENNNLFDLLEKKRTASLLSMDEFSVKFGVSKQAYRQWKHKGNIPGRHVRKAAELLGLSNKEAEGLNFRKEYSGSNTNSIKLLEKRRIELGLNKKSFTELLGCDLATYRNWRKAGRVPDDRIKKISEATKINFDLLMESNFN
ncbi:helix-turn-helix transcriptional regulator [Streptococcus canis]|uniref:helix-turn-helix domain-containing protein n=1 Tax=Streptococcus canis TaxID=1329 RepID=UPI002F9648F8